MAVSIYPNHPLFSGGGGGLVSKVDLYYPKNVCISAFVNSKSLKRRSWVRGGGGSHGIPCTPVPCKYEQN